MTDLLEDFDFKEELASLQEAGSPADRYMLHSSAHMSAFQKYGVAIKKATSSGDAELAKMLRKIGKKHKEAGEALAAIAGHHTGAAYTKELNKKDVSMTENIDKVETVINESWDKMSDDAKELVLHADNESHLHHSSEMPIKRNLSAKFRKGKYDHEKAPKLWAYHADRAAQSYSKQHGTPDQPWHKMFSPGVRKEAAKHWADRHHDDMKAGIHESVDDNFDEVMSFAVDRKPLAFADRVQEMIRDRVADMVADRKLDLASEVNESSYSKDAVDASIKSSRQKIGGKEGKKIHALLKGWRGDKEDDSKKKSMNESYPMTYLKLHKKTSDTGLVDHAEFHHTSLDLPKGNGDDMMYRKNVQDAIKANPKHKAMLAKGYTVHTNGQHVTKKDHYTYPVKVTKDD
jgi:hypothetical protein